MKATSELFRILVSEFETSTADLGATVGFYVELYGTIRRVQRVTSQGLLQMDGT